MPRLGSSGRRQPPPGGWWSPTARKLHLTLAVGLPGCLAAGWFELTRALHGHEVAWVYAGEWPLYGFVGIYMWWRLLHSEVLADATADEVESPADSKTMLEGAHAPIPAADPQLVAWQSYLEELHKVDPPGEPPLRDR